MTLANSVYFILNLSLLKEWLNTAYSIKNKKSFYVHNRPELFLLFSERTFADLDLDRFSICVVLVSKETYTSTVYSVLQADLSTIFFSYAILEL